MPTYKDPDTGVEVWTQDNPQGIELMRSYKGIVAELKKEREAWIEEMRSKGCKASHPNDGWVKREEQIMYFAYPHFNDGATVGDLVALGDNEKYMIVELTGKDTSFMNEKSYTYKIISYYPEPVEPKRLFQRIKEYFSKGGQT